MHSAMVHAAAELLRFAAFTERGYFINKSKHIMMMIRRTDLMELWKMSSNIHLELMQQE